MMLQDEYWYLKTIEDEDFQLFNVPCTSMKSINHAETYGSLQLVDLRFAEKSVINAFDLSLW